MRKVPTISHLIQEVACNYSRFSVTAPPNLTAAKATLLYQLLSAQVNAVDNYRYYR